MSSFYNEYLDFLTSSVEKHSLAAQTETNIYPLFEDISRLINHYQNTISKFGYVQDELISYVENLEFEDTDFDFYQELFKKLRQLDGFLTELKTKQVPPSITNEVQSFIVDAYKSTSLYNIAQKEEQVLSKINFTYEVQRVREPSGCLSIIVLLITAFTIFSFTIINH